MNVVWIRTHSRVTVKANGEWQWSGRTTLAESHPGSAPSCQSPPTLPHQHTHSNHTITTTKSLLLVYSKRQKRWNLTNAWGHSSHLHPIVHFSRLIPMMHYCKSDPQLWPRPRVRTQINDLCHTCALKRGRIVACVHIPQLSDSHLLGSWAVNAP